MREGEEERESEKRWLDKKREKVGRCSHEH